MRRWLPHTAASKHCINPGEHSGIHINRILLKLIKESSVCEETAMAHENTDKNPKVTAPGNVSALGQGLS